MLDEFNKSYEFRTRTCETLLLQFKTPQVYDLTTPDAYSIYGLVVIAGRIMNGEKINQSEVNCVTTNIRWHPLEEHHLSTLSPRVSQGLMEILHESREKNSFLTNYMRGRSDLFAHEWHVGEGTWFRFRDGKREKLEKEVESYFTKIELKDFDKIGNLFQPYISRVSSPAKAKQS